MPEVRTRQWVLSFPFQLRWALAFHHDLVKALARLTYAEIARRYLRLAREEGVVSPRGGAFFVIERFGSDLRLNVHLHALFLDGASGDDDAFFTAPAPSPREVEAILARIVARANELLEARADALSITDDEPALAHAHHEATSRRGAVKHAPDHDELDGQVILPTRARPGSTASTSTPRWLSRRTTTSAARDCSATSSGRRSRTTDCATSRAPAEAW